jgi:hypothetical protein
MIVVFLLLFVLYFDTFVLDPRYVEFMRMASVRRGTELNPDYEDLHEKIINDIVAMDAAYDPAELPDLSIGL